ncbi:MAG: sulfatase-like hydrolase/transferase [Planctomycetes bacterium]|nr:sulfatase-like hydrolase/transferase [Planctomycetota bacterium]
MEVPTFLLQDLAVGLAFGLGLFLVCRRGRPRDDLVLPLLGLAFLLWLALAGIVVTGLLALPVGAKLLLQAPSLIFLETALNAGSVQSSVSKLAAFALVGPLAALGGALWLRPGWGREPPCPRPWLALALIPLALSPWASFDARYRDTHPAVTLLSSALSLGLHQDPPDPGIPAELFRANVSDLGEGLAPIDSRLAALHWDGQSRYDVLVVVLETGVAPVLDLGRDITHEGRPWLPVLRRLARRSVWGQRHIAPFPGSTKSIFSLVASRYPYPDYRSLIRTRPEAPLETLPGRLAARGYRTGSYASIEGDYDRMDTFLSAHGFAELGDKESLGLTSLSNPTFGSDRDLYAAYQRWLVKSEDPSLFVLLPSNSHWPFYAPPEDTLFPGQDRLSRYKNALEHQDRLLGEHYAWLAAQGRLERTIVIVVADHGSYFDLAGAADDASPLGLLEHHVPLLIDHPRLRHGAGVVIPEATAHVDLGPTLLGMLSDQMPPADWQGLSLLEPRPVQRLVFFYQDFAEGRLAATDGRWVIAWNRERDVMSHAEWAGGPALLAPGQAGEERLRTFFAYQLTSLGRAR